MTSPAEERTQEICIGFPKKNSGETRVDPRSASLTPQNEIGVLRAHGDVMYHSAASAFKAEQLLADGFVLQNASAGRSSARSRAESKIISSEGELLNGDVASWTLRCVAQCETRAAALAREPKRLPDTTAPVPKPNIEWWFESAAKFPVQYAARVCGCRSVEIPAMPPTCHRASRLRARAQWRLCRGPRFSRELVNQL